MKIICPYCHEENEIDISVGDSFLCKDCKKEIKIVKTGKFTKSSWIIVSILLVLVVLISIYALRSNSALKIVNEELSKKLNSNTEELNKVIAKNTSESQQLNSNIEKFEQEKLAPVSETVKTNVDFGKADDENITPASKSQCSFLDSKAYITFCNNNIKYSEAINCIKNKEFDSAKAIFEGLGEFKDSKNKLYECNRNINLNRIKDAEVGTIVTFGSYEQDGAKKGKEAIEWIVLDKKASEALLLSKYGLESKNYHDSDENTNWEKCSIRKWLNNDFYEESFNDYEKSNVEFVKINYYDTLKSEIAFTTEDGVFLLSSDEFNTYKNRFKENIKCEPTERVKLQRNVDKDRKDFYYWRLRSQGTSVSDKDNKAVDENGDINQDYYYNAFYPDSTLNKGLIRPAIWVKFSE